MFVRSGCYDQRLQFCKIFRLAYTWNEVTILWNEVTLWWNEVTKGWNEVVWNEVVMERSDRIPALGFLHSLMHGHVRTGLISSLCF